MSKPLIRVFLIETATIRYPHLDQFGLLDIHFGVRVAVPNFNSGLQA